LFENAVRNAPITPELLAQWKIDFCLIWQRDSAKVQLVSIVGADLAGRQRGLRYGMDRIAEVWDQTGSELQNLASDSTTMVTYCHVWLPRFLSGQAASNDNSSNLPARNFKGREMLVSSFQVDPQLLAAKKDLSEAARVYNTLALMKESLLRDKIFWSGAALLIMLLSAFSVYAARRLSQHLSRPIESLTATMGEVARGNLRVRAEVPARDEISTLVNSFNQMIEDLRVSREKLIASEKLAAWREVARQVSHEIKNPLTAMQLALYRLRQRIANGNDKESAVRESFQSLEDELAGLRRLAEEFSEFAN
jgi:nitrogen fixation/metabolism regulation signal transduction histidine kinase